MNISIIEDSLVDSKLLINHLKKFGHKTMVYDTIESFSDNNTPFDLLLLDVNMTPMNGADYLKILRTKSKKPVVLTTGLESFDPVIIDCCSHSNVSFLQKPITKNKLEPLLNYYSKQYLTLQTTFLKHKVIKKLPHIVNLTNKWRPPSGKTSGASNGIEYRKYQRLL